MYRYFKLGNKYLIIKPYTTEIELNILECLEFNEFSEEDYRPIADYFLENTVINLSTYELSDLEKILTIWYIRMITIGDEISLTYKCEQCGKIQNTIISLNDFISQPTKFSENIKTLILSDSEYEKVNKDEILDEDLDIDVYEQLNLFDFYFIYKHFYSFECDKCKYLNNINLITYKNALSFLSEESLQSLTSWIHVLVYSDKHTRSDVLKMTPIERMLEINYFKEQIKKESEDE